MYIAVSIAVFVFAYMLNALTITIGYHRALAHGSITLHPRLRDAVILLGNWITGLDPKAWVVMHRMHHAYSDTPEDPHSPNNVGLVGILLEQLRSYENVIRGLAKGEEYYTQHAHGLDFRLSWLNRKRLWWLPYVMHLVVALAIAIPTGAWLLGVCWFVGMMSHPFQGGMVNSLGHAVGGRNFDTPDDSRNNLLVSILILGEGYQNNHHQFPSSAKFSYRPWEIDMGFGFCLLFETMGLVRIRYELVIPPPPFLVDLVVDLAVDPGVSPAIPG
jgi:stearoyl-CoA desaturase (delta-9 desaturase)